MAITNFETSEIIIKILYLGASGVGKTENLRALLKQLSPEIRAGLFRLDCDQSNFCFYDYLALSLGNVKDYHLKAVLYAADDLLVMPEVASSLFHGIDGIVFVLDPQASALERTVASFDQVKLTMERNDIPFESIPIVYQFNKIDKADPHPIRFLREEVLPQGCLSVEAEAKSGRGVFETFKRILSVVFGQLSLNEMAVTRRE